MVIFLHHIVELVPDVIKYVIVMKKDNARIIYGHINYKKCKLKGFTFFIFYCIMNKEDNKNGLYMESSLLFDYAN